MNWTGGRLSRHSAASKSVNLKQKQHFAKIQQSLRNKKPTNSPARWSILNHVVEEKTGNNWKKPSAVGSDGNTGAAVPNTPNYKSIAHKSCSEKSLEEVDNKVYHHEQIQITDGSQTFDRKHAHVQTTGASSTRKSFVDQGGSHRKLKDQEEEAARNRRNELLQKANWIESSTLLPAKRSLKSHSNDNNIGKRRKVSGSQRPQFRSRAAHIDSPFAERRVARHGPLFASPQGENCPSNDIQVLIGGQVVPIELSSSVARSRISLPHTRVDMAEARSRTSSIMLLDNVASPLIRTPFLGGVKNNASPLTEMPPGIKAQSWLRSISRQQPFPQFPDHSLVSRCDLADLRPHGRGDIVKSTFDHPISLPNSPMRRSKRPATSDIVVFSSSTVEIQQPIPQTFRRFEGWRIDSAQSVRSNIAQVGENKPIISQDQLLDDVIWRTWLASSNDSGTHMGHDQQRYLDVHSPPFISPGVSVVLPKAFQNARLGTVVNDDSDVDVSHSNSSSKDNAAYPDVLGSSRPQTTEYNSEEQDRPEFVPHRPNALPAWSHKSIHNHNEQIRIADGASRLSNRSFETKGERTTSSKSTRLNLARSQQREEEELWKSFVNGKDGNDDEFVANYSNTIVLDRNSNAHPHDFVPITRSIKNIKNRFTTPYYHRTGPMSSLQNVSVMANANSSTPVSCPTLGEFPNSVRQIGRMWTPSIELESLSICAAPATTVNISSEFGDDEVSSNVPYSSSSYSTSWHGNQL